MTLRRDLNPMPAEVRQALEARALVDAYQARPPFQRNDYLGWIGLMVPHMARLLTGPRFDRLLPAAALIGAGFMVLVDTAARSIAQMEVPLGILTAVLGAPVFVGLLARGTRGWAE